MADVGKLIRLAEGSVILTEGEVNPGMFKIIKGHAEVYMGYGTDKETLIGIIGPQACFGELGMLLGKSSIYTVIAYSEILLMSITKGEMGDFVQQNHKNIIQIMENMARTMMTMRTQIDLLVEDLKEDRKPDDRDIHNIRKTVGTCSVYRKSGLHGKFHTLDLYI